VPEIGEPIAKCPGAEAFTVGVIDSEIMGMDTIEGAGLSYHGGQP
jgi:hypothetical protein